jgi:Ribbon-helix-helix protein, copG family.
MRIVSVKMSKVLLEKLDRYCKERKITRSEAIRKAVEKLLSSEGF